MLALAVLLCASCSTPQHSGPHDDSLRQRAESLLVAGQLQAARDLAETLQATHPDDPAVLTLLGRIWLAWPVYGRFRAESLLVRASLLDPDNPAPLYYLGQVGLALGGDDGESIARRGLVRVLALNPDYRDAWALWHRLYRSDDERQAALDALSLHHGSWNADYWRAQLLVEQHDNDSAVALLQGLSDRRPRDAGARAWLARALFQAGKDAQGAVAYEAALQRADDDTADVLWRQLRGIATPAERQAYAATPADARAGFLRSFWVTRTPSLSDSVNARFGEHFRRLGTAERYFTLLHPNARYFHSPTMRALSGGVGLMPGPNVRAAYAASLDAGCEPRLSGVLNEPVQAGLAPRVENPSGETANLEDGLDDRGRVFLRHGRPDNRFIGPHMDSETWCYYQPDGRVLRVSFLRRTGVYDVSGDMVVTPMVVGEVESAQELLATDRFDARSDLDFTFWPAAFRADRGHTELVLVPDSLAAVAVLADGDGRLAARDSATGRALRLLVPPGQYALLIDATLAGKTGRYRGAMPLPDFGGEEPAVSSLLVAAGSTPAVRDSLIAAAPHGLRLPSDQPLRFYAELYNMGRVDGVARYAAEYRFERTDGSILPGRRERASTVSFERERPFEPVLVESVVIDPGRLPSGRYRLRLEVADRVLGTRVASATIAFVIR